MGCGASAVASRSSWSDMSRVVPVDERREQQATKDGGLQAFSTAGTHILPRKQRAPSNNDPYLHQHGATLGHKDIRPIPRGQDPYLNRNEIEEPILFAQFKSFDLQSQQQGLTHLKSQLKVAGPPTIRSHMKHDRRLANFLQGLDPTEFKAEVAQRRSILH